MRSICVVFGLAGFLAGLAGAQTRAQDDALQPLFAHEVVLLPASEGERPVELPSLNAFPAPPLPTPPAAGPERAPDHGTVLATELVADERSRSPAGSATNCRAEIRSNGAVRREKQTRQGGCP